MNYTLFDLFLNAYNGNSFAQLQIVQRFQPLLKKYAALLKRLPAQIEYVCQYELGAAKAADELLEAVPARRFDGERDAA